MKRSEQKGHVRTGEGKQGEKKKKKNGNVEVFFSSLTLLQFLLESL